MIMIFSDFLGNSLEVLIDDFSLFEEDFNDCFDHLTRILEVWVKKQLVLSRKSHFKVREGIGLKHLVCSKGLKVDKAKIKVV